MVKFSIIIPVYNTQDYLERCFNSVINQTYSNYEVIMINDSSIDTSLSIIKKYCKKYNFKYINNKKIWDCLILEILVLINQMEIIFYF